MLRRRAPAAGVRRRAAAAGLIGAILLAACTLLELRQQAREFYASTVLVGRIGCPAGWQGPVIVAALDAAHGDRPVHAALLHECGGYELIVPRGEYRLVGYGDANRNGRHDPGEPGGRHAEGRPVAAPDSGVVTQLDFELAAEIAAPVLAALPATPRHSTQAGALADLDAPAFSAESGRHGYWEPMRSFESTGGNIYFVEPYDPARTPVLFVHGAAGSPQDLRAMIEHLDRRRYQAWFYAYPSGAALDSMAYLLYWKLLGLQLRHRYERLHIVAHSMGGLVVRKFLLDHGAQFPQLRLFVTLSTPWGGESAAELGVQHSPAVVPSWVDLQPGGAFLRDLYARPLPPQVEHHLWFGHRGGYSLLRPNHDGTVTLASQLHDPAQREARVVMGFDADHQGILAAPPVLRQLDLVLAQGSAAAPSGGIAVTYSTPDGMPLPRGLVTLLLTPLDAPQRRLVFALAPGDQGRRIGPLAPGNYQASLLAAGHAGEPSRQPVRIEGGAGAAHLAFRLRPQGTLSGYVGADGAAQPLPAGSFRPPHAELRLESATLSGAGTQRTLRPQGDVDLLVRYLDGEDALQGAWFSFVGLAPGRYTLELRAAGREPHVSTHEVAAGQGVVLEAVVLKRRDGND